jgi:cysteinyl-tRNA synthetase
MKSQFDTLIEGFLPSTIRVVTRTRYPKQIQFSEEFMTAVKKEYARLQTVTESGEEGQAPVPIKNYKEKFLKALNFCVHTF